MKHPLCLKRICANSLKTTLVLGIVHFKQHSYRLS